MSRFRWLELDEDGIPGGAGPTKEAGPRGLDEHICLEKGDAALRLGQYESALQWYSRVLRYAIELEEAWFGQVLCLLNLEENVEANIWADRGLARFPESPDLLAAKAMALGRTRGASMAMGYSDASLTVKGKAVGLYPWIVRGDLVLNGSGDQANVQRCFNKALELGGRDWYTHYLIGLSLLRKEMWEQALTRFSAAEKMERKNAPLLSAMGQCYERLGAVAAAKSAYRKALAVDSKCPTARKRLPALERVGPIRRLWRWLIRRG